MLIGVASVLAGTAVLLAVTGVVYNLVLVVFAAPFGVAAYFIWYHATGRLAERVRARTARQRARTKSFTSRDDGRWRRGTRHQGEERSRREASRILGVEADAGTDAIRRAYRERVKEVHPDADGGSEEEFKRVTAAYEQLLNS